MTSSFPIISGFLLPVIIAGIVSFYVNRAIHRWWLNRKNFATKARKQAQDFHEKEAPRTGGIGLFAGLMVGLLLADWSAQSWLLITCLMPSFLAGIFEDTAKKEISPWIRLAMPLVSGLLAIFLLDASFNNTGIYFLDSWLAGSQLFSIFCILLITTGAAHSTNVIDGFNGLMPGYGIIACTAFLWLAAYVEDTELLITFSALLGALIGLFIINFPKGTVFSGDSGAYLLGSCLAIAAILLLDRNQQISPWFPMAIMSYPVGETIFSILRKRLILGRPAMQPDEWHLHMVLHRFIKKHFKPKNANAMTSPFLWPLTLIPAIGACIYALNTKVLIIICLGYGTLYIFIYVIMVMREMIEVSNNHVTNNKAKKPKKASNK